MTEYTGRVEEFQIRDIAYFGKPPIDAPIRFDIVKWIPEKKPYIGTVYHSTSIGWVSTEELISEHCYSVATLEWNDQTDRQERGHPRASSNNQKYSP